MCGISTGALPEVRRAAQRGEGAEEVGIGARRMRRGRGGGAWAGGWGAGGGFWWAPGAARLVRGLGTRRRFLVAARHDRLGLPPPLLAPAVVPHLLVIPLSRTCTRRSASKKGAT